MLLAVGVGVTKCATTGCPRAVTPHALAPGAGALGDLPHPQGLLLGSERAHRRRGDRERRQRVQAARSRRTPRGRSASSAWSRSRCSSASPTSPSRHARAAERDRLRRLPGRPRRLPRRQRTARRCTGSSRSSRSRCSILAANTSFQGFPRLSALLAQDRFIARQFTNLGDRLVYSNGVVVLAGRGVAAHLDLPRQRQQPHPSLRRRRVHRVHPLAGRHGPLLAPNARLRVAVAGADQRRRSGRDVRRHGRRRADEVHRGRVDGDRRDPAHGARLLRRSGATTGACCAGSPRGRRPSSRRRRHATGRCSSSSRSTRRPTAVSGSRAGSPAATSARSTCRGMAVDPGIRPRWFRHVGDQPRLEVLDPSGGVVDAVLEQIWRLPRGESDFVTIVIPEQFREASLLEQRRRKLEFLLKFRLLSEPGVVVADVPAVVGQTGPPPGAARRPGDRRQRERGVDARRELRADAERRGHPGGALRLQRRRCARHAARVVGRTGRASRSRSTRRPYRDLGKPLLRYLRDLTADGDTTVLVLMPELVTRGLAPSRCTISARSTSSACSSSSPT